ncbi:helix-hairpin-helix domain-containing protein [Rubrivirga sp. S365]|uniref:helix-hairpin-helix domain-containing protein n=1 Tax=Rubrivirga sp. S365 TaxID=3076080 RepID=UPI0028C68320|nr:helix-hairpin-helix domain-containing protein [Rubrivirga sp. S365]MDT7858129.1 helix-hairpin-helix domain-containing protein [Rubrivirga sp. S365]
MPDDLTSVPGIGPALAVRVRDALGVDSLDALREAAETGRLSTVPGVGHKTAEAVLDHLGGERSDDNLVAPPSVAELLDVDREYRERADAGNLHTIAPRRNNPEGGPGSRS